MAPVSIALIGGGMFAKMEHMVSVARPSLLGKPLTWVHEKPAIMKCDELQLNAIYSRTLKSAQATAELNTKGKVDLYSSDSGDGASLDDLLKRDDIQGVIIALPIASQPKFIEQAIRAGKHVLAEKPISPNVDSAKRLMELVSTQPNVTLSIAENYRFIPKFIYAAEQAKKFGKVHHFSVKCFHFMEADSFWYSTGWRGNPQHQGGPILDGGIHYAAATRMFLEGESAAESTSAFTSLTCKYLPPIDTINAIIQTKSRASGTIQISFGSRIDALEWDFGLEGGSVKVSEDTVTVKPVGGEAVVKNFPSSSGVPEEVNAWAQGIQAGKQNSLQSMQEALADLEFLEKIFRSGEQKGAVTKYLLQ